jgi:hypothetical protein
MHFINPLNRKRAGSALAAILLVLFLAPMASGAPVFGETWQLRQPDGSLVDVKIWGDEYYQVVESLDGYTLTRDPATMVICYARVSGNGDVLESTGVELGSRDPGSLGLSQHVRISQAAMEAVVAEARSRPLANPSPDKAANYSPAVTGSVEGVCIIVDFDDQTATIAQSEVDDF